MNNENFMCNECRDKFDSQFGDILVLDMCDECRMKVFEAIFKEGTINE